MKIHETDEHEATRQAELHNGEKKHLCDEIPRKSTKKMKSHSISSQKKYGSLPSYFLQF